MYLLNSMFHDSPLTSPRMINEFGHQLKATAK